MLKRLYGHLKNLFYSKWKAPDNKILLSHTHLTAVIVMCLWPLTPLCRTAWCAGKAACARPSWETLAWRRKYQITGQSITSVFIMTSINTLRLDKSRSISYIPLLLHFCLIYLSHRICRSKVFINVSRSFSFLFRWDIVTHKERHITHTKAQSGFSKVCMLLPFSTRTHSLGNFLLILRSVISRGKREGWRTDSGLTHSGGVHM